MMDDVGEKSIQDKIVINNLDSNTYTSVPAMPPDFWSGKLPIRFTGSIEDDEDGKDGDIKDIRDKNIKNNIGEDGKDGDIRDKDGEDGKDKNIKNNIGEDIKDGDIKGEDIKGENTRNNIGDGEDIKDNKKDNNGEDKDIDSNTSTLNDANEKSIPEEIKSPKTKKSESNRFIEFITNVFNEIINHKKGETKYIQEFHNRGLKYDTVIETKCCTGCPMTNSFSMRDLILEQGNGNQSCALSPDMYDFMIQNRIIEPNDLNIILCFFQIIYDESRFHLIEHIVNVSDIKMLVEYRDEHEHRSLLHYLLYSRSTWPSNLLLNIFKKFKNAGFDLRTKSKPLYGNGNTLLNLAILHSYNDLIYYLLSNGCRFEDGDFNEIYGIQIITRRVNFNESIEQYTGANSIQALLAKAYPRMSAEKMKKKIIYEADWLVGLNHVNLEDRKQMENDKMMEEKNDEEYKKKYKNTIFETISACLKFGYKIDMPDQYGFVLRDYVLVYVSGDSFYFPRYMNLINRYAFIQSELWSDDKFGINMPIVLVELMIDYVSPLNLVKSTDTEK